MLTHIEKKTLTFVKAELDAKGVAPSFDEIKTHLGVAAKSTVHRIVFNLEQKGRIRRLPHRSRAIEVVEITPGFDLDALGDYIIATCYTTPPSAGFQARLKEAIACFIAEDGNPPKRRA